MARDYNFALFHTLVESLTALTCCGIFAIGWNSRVTLPNSFYVFLGTGFLFSGFLLFGHALSHKGVQLFPGYDADLPAQLWIASRLIAALSVLIAPAFLESKVSPGIIFGVFLTAFMALLAAIFGRLFPACYIEGAGRLPFAVVTEWIIGGLFAIALVGYRTHARKFDGSVLYPVRMSVLIALASEVTLSVQRNPHADSVFAGHILELLSVATLYVGMVEIGMKRPVRSLFRELAVSKDAEQTALEAAKECEMRLRRVLNNLVAFVGVLSPDGTLLETNWDHNEQPGGSDGGFIGKKLWKCDWCSHSPEVEAQVHNACERALQGQTVRHDLQVRTRFGDAMWIDFQVSPIRNSQGAVEFLISSAVDLTARKRAEERLQRSESEARALADELTAMMEAMPALMFIAHDPECRRMTASKGGLKQMGVFQGNVSFSAEVPPPGLRPLQNGRELRPEELPMQIAAATGTEVRDFELTIAFENGKSRDLAGHAVPLFDHAGNVRGAVGAFLDITERKAAEDALRESEQRFRVMADGLPLMIWVTDKNGDLEFANETYREIFNIRKEDIQGGKWQLILDPETGPAYEAEFRACLHGRRPFHGEVRIQSDSQMRWVESWARPRWSSAGDFLGYVGTSADITERREAQEALRVAKEQAEAASRAKDDFLAVLSHELRTPLTPVLLALSVLENLTPDGADIIQMTRRNVEMEARLIDDLLDLTRIGRRMIELKLESLDLRDVVRAALDVCLPEIREKQVHFEEQVTADPLPVYADSSRLQQVFWNLIRNAFKFTPEGGRICIQVSRAGDSGVVRVIDTGKGIPPAAVSRIFEPFEQGSPAITRHFGGLGLGLAIGKGIVDLHQGTISAESPGENLGATFTVAIPLNREFQKR